MPITGDVIIRAGRLSRRVLLFAALALATIPAAAHAAPGLEFSPSSPVVFGNTTVGQSSEQVLTLTNTSSPPQSVNIFGRVLSGADAGEFSLGPNTCPPTLAQGASCTFSVRFNPSHPGNSTAQLEVNNNSANQPLVRQLNGTGVAPDLSFSPNSLDFGLVLVEERDGMASITVQNAGAAPVQVNQVEIDGPDTSAFRMGPNSCQGQTLAVNQTCSVQVHFEPQEARTYNAILHARAGATDFQASLTGVGGIGDLLLTPNPLDFGNVPVGSSSTGTITTRSVGNAPFASIFSTITGGDVDALRVVRDTCSPRLLLPGQTCTTTVRFTPTVEGPVEAALALVGDGFPHTAVVRGVGTKPAVSPPPPRGARVAFIRKSQVARLARGRVRLGRARCDGAQACTVSVRSQFAVKIEGVRRPYLVRGRTQSWTLRRSRPVWIALPSDVRGTALRVILTLKTRAAGLPATVQRKVLRLVPANAKS